LKKSEQNRNKELSIGIKSRRAALGLTIEQLAEEAEIPYPTLRDIEAGYSEGSPKTKAKLTEFFKCTLSELYRPIDQTRDKSQLVGDIVLGLATLNDGQLKDVLALITKFSSASSRVRAAR